MRLFIAIDLENQEYFKEMQENIPGDIVKLTLPKVYHLTLKFLGEVKEEDIPKIKETLQSVEFETFTIKTTHIGVFPDEHFIRVVWVGLEPEGKITQLKDTIDNALKDMFGVEKEFKPHITLARVKFVKDKPTFIKSLKHINIQPKEFTINEIKLIKSTLTPEGPVYEDLK